MDFFYFKGASEAMRRGKKMSNPEIIEKYGRGYGYVLNRSDEIILVDSKGEPLPPRNFTRTELFTKCWMEVSKDKKASNSLALVELDSIPSCSSCGAEFTDQEAVDELEYVTSSATADHYKCSVCGKDEVSV